MGLHIGLLSESFPPLIDGVSNTVYNYARYIQQNHGDCMVVTPKVRNARDDYPFPVLRFDAVVPKRDNAYSVGNPFDLRILNQVQKSNLDLLHIHSPFASSVMASLLTPQHKIPTILTYHTKFEIDFEARIDSAIARKVAMGFVMMNIRAADEVWAVSRGTADSLRQQGYEGSLRVMENGTDFVRGKIPKAAVDRLFAEQYGITPDELVFIYTGRMMWYKNIQLIIDALAGAKDRGLKFRMFFIGSGDELPEIEDYAKAARIASCTTFTGPIRDRELLRHYFSRANLFLFPSTYDTSGIVVKEAAACSCPSVLTRGSCAAENVRDDVNGFLSDENAADLCATILSATADRDHLAQVGDCAGREIYLSWEDAVARGYARYEEITEEWKQKNSGNTTGLFTGW